MENFKQKIIEHCFSLLEEKIHSFQIILSDLEEGTINDSKSSAGDKHETARAMVQIEQEKISRQLHEVIHYKKQLEKLMFVAAHDEIMNGSLVKSNNGFVFLSVPLGKIEVSKVSVMVISPQSPLGIKLLGLKSGTATEMNATKYLIENIE